MLNIDNYSEFHDNNSNRGSNLRQKSEVPVYPADEQQGGQPDEDAEDLGAGGGGQQHHEALRQGTQRLHGRPPSVVLSLLCSTRRSCSNKNETSLEADEPDYNHEEKLKTHEEKKHVSADQPSLRRTSGAKDREIPQRLFVCL